MSDSTQPNSAKESKADAKAEKARAKAMRPWFKKKRFILPLAVVAVIVLSTALRGGNSGGSTASSNDSTNNSSPSNSDSAASNWYTDNYASFTAVDFSGSGDDVVSLPAGAINGLINATYKGSSNFVIESLDTSNQTADLAVNTIGNYSGTTVYGVNSLGGEVAKLKVTASGKWTLHVAPLDSAPALPSSGKGDGVFKYESTDSPTWVISHKGQSNFAVNEESDSSIMGLLVNEIGNYNGTVPAYAGPALVIITADGSWTIATK